MRVYHRSLKANCSMLGSSLGRTIKCGALAGALLTAMSGNGAEAQTCAAYTYSFSSGTNAVASQVNQNFDDIRNCANNNLAPIASPSFTGNVGIGMTAAYSLDITKNVNGLASGRISNNNGGTSSGTAWQVTNGTASGAIALLGSGFSIGPSTFRQEGVLVDADGAGGLTLNTSAVQPIYFAVNRSEVARFHTNNSFLINTTIPLGSAEALSVMALNASNPAALFKHGTAATRVLDLWNAGTSGDNLFVNFYTEGSATLRGSISYNRMGGAVSYNTTSDYRLKDILGDFTGSGASIDAIPVHLGRMKDATLARPMFVAHEVQPHMPWAVTGKKDAIDTNGTIIPQMLNEPAMIATLWAEVRALRTRVHQLELDVRQ